MRLVAERAKGCGAVRVGWWSVKRVPAVTAAIVVPEAGLVMERIASQSRAPRTGPSAANVADAVIGRVVVGSVLAASESRGRELSARVRA